MPDEVTEDNSSALTLEQAALLFEEDLPGDNADTEDSAKPPAPEPDADEPEVASEQTEGEAESPDAEQPETDETPAPESELYTITVDGEELQVTREELLKGYSRQADYSRKTMKLAEDRKAVEARDQQLATERATYAARLVSLEQAIKQQTPQEPDWHALRATANPAEFAALYAEWSHHKEQMKALAEERSAAEQAVQRDQQKAFESHLNEQKQILNEAFPDLADPEKGKAFRSTLVAAAESVGFEKKDLSNVTDARLIKLLHKAALYDAAQQKRPVIQQKIEKVKAATPGTASNAPAAKTAKERAIQAARKRLAQSGSIADAAALMELTEG